MKKLIAVFFLFCSSLFARTYTTNFPLTENPISESGNWVNGLVTGLDWSNVQTTPALGFGTQATYSGAFNGIYNDSTALLTGAWSPDQTVQATVRILTYPNLNLGNSEVELRLRSTLTAHNCNGYEINFRVTNDPYWAYVEITRWNGTRGSYTQLARVNNDPKYILVNGDIIKASMIGNIITVWKNGIQLISATDSVFASGSPGIGFWHRQNPGPVSNYGFSSLTVSDTGAPPLPPPPDTTPPLAPSNLTIVGNLAWSASTDNVGVTGYRVYDNGTQIGQTAALNITVTLSPGSHAFTVRAFDAAGNISNQSNQVTVTVP